MGKRCEGAEMTPITKIIKDAAIEYFKPLVWVCNWMTARYQQLKEKAK
jgi:hypothetical protein